MKRVAMIHTKERTQIAPEFCDHRRTVFMNPGHEYTVSGERTDNTEAYEQCLDCGWVLRDDRTWGPHLTKTTDQIPFEGIDDE